MSKAPLVITTIRDFKDWRDSQSATLKIGFVPTMGALHAGHAALLQASRKKNDLSVLSIFVNPTQFAPNEDFSKYPRTLENDLKLAHANGVDVVFTPTAEDLYPNGYSTHVSEETISKPLCGPFRPGHFQGVATIVLKLFNIVRPTSTFFGLKDAQQFFVIQKMIADLNLNIELEGIETVREPDGLALSSRNRYLSTAERETAPWIYRVLTQTSQRLREGGVLESLLSSAKAELSQKGFDVQYFDCIELPRQHKRLLATASFLGKTRLIDNVIF